MRKTESVIKLVRYRLRLTPLFSERNLEQSVLYNPDAGLHTHPLFIVATYMAICVYAIYAYAMEIRQ